MLLHVRAPTHCFLIASLQYLILNHPPLLTWHLLLHQRHGSFLLLLQQVPHSAVQRLITNEQELERDQVCRVALVGHECVELRGHGLQGAQVAGVLRVRVGGDHEASFDELWHDNELVLIMVLLQMGDHEGRRDSEDANTKAVRARMTGRTADTHVYVPHEDSPPVLQVADAPGLQRLALLQVVIAAGQGHRERAHIRKDGAVGLHPGTILIAQILPGCADGHADVDVLQAERISGRAEHRERGTLWDCCPLRVLPGASQALNCLFTGLYQGCLSMLLKSLASACGSGSSSAWPYMAAACTGMRCAGQPCP